MSAIMPWVTWYTITAYIVVSFVGWFLLNALEYCLNSGQLGRGRWWVFECFWEDFLDNVPGGMVRKIEKLKTMVGPPHPNVSGTFAGSRRSWSYEELREKGNWEECARAIFKSPLRFWLWTICLSFLFAAFFVAVLVVSMIISGIIGTIYETGAYLFRSLGLNSTD